MNEVEVRHFHLFCGLGGGAMGFNRGQARVGQQVAKFRCLGGVDVDDAAIKEFTRLVGVPGTVIDLFDRDQYKAFHGIEPTRDWREATPDDIRKAAGGERPHIVFLSAPCKGFSGLLAEGKSKTDKYQALNRLTVRGVWMMLEAWSEDLPELIVFENVPRIATRGRHLLDQIGDLLRAYDYAVAESTHDCGELGGLAQSRKRFLMVARHRSKVPPFLYEPPKRYLQGVGTVLARMPLPGDPAGGPMHRIPRLAWKTWVRLAFVEAGSDWRSLNKLAIKDGFLRDYLIMPDVRQTGGDVCRSSDESFSIADPRFDSNGNDYGQYGVCPWDASMGAIINVKSPGQGKFSVQDPRPIGPIFGKYAVTRFDEPTGTVIAGNAQGAYAVADPRPNMKREKGDNYLTGGHYGVLPWSDTSGAVSAAASHDNGRWSVADPRMDLIPHSNDKLVAIIRALDGTWHRPFTTLELASLQGLVDPEEQLILDGLSDSAWRERIGNAVPPPAAEAIASEMGRTLLLAWTGETFSLSATPIWVRQVVAAMSVDDARQDTASDSGGYR